MHDHHASHSAPDSGSHSAQAHATTTLVVPTGRGMHVEPSSAKHQTEYQGRTHYFCAPGCREAIEAEPKRYLEPADKPSM